MRIDANVKFSVHHQCSVNHRLLRLPTTVYFFLQSCCISRTKHGIHTVPVSPESHRFRGMIYDNVILFVYSLVIHFLFCHIFI